MAEVQQGVGRPAEGAVATEAFDPGNRVDPARRSEAEQGDGPPSTGQLVSDVTEQVSRLMRDEMALARAEMTTKAKRAGLGAGLLGGGGLIALYGVGCLVAAAVLGITVALPAWLAALIIGVALLAVAGVSALAGKTEAQRATPPMPEEAVGGVQTDIETVKEHARR